MVESILHQGANTNCEEDLDEFLLSLEAVPHPSAVGGQLFQAQPHPYLAMVTALPQQVQDILSVCSLPDELTGPQEDQNTLSFTESNILAYIGGYIARKLRGKVCDTCTEKLVCSRLEEQDSSLSFIKMKKYEGAKDGLILPSIPLVKALETAEQVYRSVIDQVMYEENVRSSLVSSLVKNGQWDILFCGKCHMHALTVHLMVNVRLHFTLKLANKSLAQDKGRKNRKVLKFSHL